MRWYERWVVCWVEMAEGLVGVLTFGACQPGWLASVRMWALVTAASRYGATLPPDESGETT